ncbi:MAG TPA: SRPBCC domain-containing protein [Geodermatophilus sp.]|nr:SRPBCC domain-containing protein [Geodermatophilus sp.]
MTEQSYTTTVTVDRAPDEVFHAINDVRGWWSEEVEGRTDQVGSQFRYRGHDEANTVEHLATIRVEQLVPGRRIVWRVLDNHFSFTDDQTEWKDTEIRFDISEKNGATEVRFTHAGLVPAYECFDVCSNAWSFYIGDSLRNLITTGEGAPISNRDRVPSRSEERIG